MPLQIKHQFKANHVTLNSLCLKMWQRPAMQPLRPFVELKSRQYVNTVSTLVLTLQCPSLWLLVGNFIVSHHNMQMRMAEGTYHCWGNWAVSNQTQIMGFDVLKQCLGCMSIVGFSDLILTTWGSLLCMYVHEHSCILPHGCTAPKVANRTCNLMLLAEHCSHRATMTDASILM